MSPRLKGLVDDGERTLPSGRRDGAITATVVGGALGPAAIPVQANAVVACLACLLAAVVRVRSTIGNLLCVYMRDFTRMNKQKADILDTGRPLFAALDLSALTLPTETSAHVLLRTMAAC